MLRCNILSIFLAFSLLAGAQDWKVVRENPQKAFPKTVAAGNYSGIAHLHDDIYAVVSDKSDSALYFNFRIQVNPKTGELEQVENLGFTERTDGTLNDGKFWQGQEKGFDHEAIVKASDSTLVITSEGYCRLKEYPVLPTSANAPKISYQQNLWESRWPSSDFIPIIILSLWLLIPSVSISGLFLRARSAKTDSLLLLKTDWPISFV